MLKQYGSVFLTLVLMLFTSPLLAKPHTQAPKDKVSSEEEVVVDPAVLEHTVVTPAEKQSQIEEFSRQYSKSDYFHIYRRAITLRAGAVYGFKDSSDDEDSTNAVFGFSFLVPRKKSPQVEVGVDLSAVGHGHFTVMSRRIYNERGAFRPFYRLGVMHKLDPDDRFASFSDFENYLARFGFGFEDTLRPASSYRIEVEMAAGPEDVLGFLTVGKVFSF